MKILVATGNAHKLDEIRSILGPLGIDLISLKDLKESPSEVVEDKDSFEGNAIKKAVQTAKETGMFCLADDCGLEVTALNGAPGVYSARYAGEGASDVENYEKLLSELSGFEDRKARFVCCIAFASPSGLIGTAEGEVRGKILQQPQGDYGFGYDPCFVPDGYELSFAELGSEIKDSISHRGNALQRAVEQNLFDI
jgi:XTP/dITP diphosphohydrolase